MPHLLKYGAMTQRGCSNLVLLRSLILEDAMTCPNQRGTVWPHFRYDMFWFFRRVFLLLLFFATQMWLLSFCRHAQWGLWVKSDAVTVTAVVFPLPLRKFTHLLETIEMVPCIQHKVQWALRWCDPTAPRAQWVLRWCNLLPATSFAKRMIAFAAVEGILFSGSFCAIFWFKKCGLMQGNLF